MKKEIAQKNLSLLWFINAGFVGLLFILFSLEKFGTHIAEGWQWFTQFIIPTLTLMIGTFVAENTKAKGQLVDNFSFRLAFGISLFYFLCIYLILATSSFVSNYKNETLIEVLNDSKVYLAIFQGVVTFSLGMFFKKNR